MEALSVDLMRALRGSLSQRAFSRSLGFTSNVAYAWESGRRFPEASVLFKLAERSPGFRERLCRLLELTPNPRVRRLGSARAVHWLLGELCGDMPLRELSDRVGVDRNTLARWLRGGTEPRLPALLDLIAVTTQRMLEFVALFVDPSELPSARTAYGDLRLQQRLAYDLPWSHALLRALELDRYRSAPAHDLELLARSVGLGPRRAAHYLTVLQSAGQVLWNGTHFECARVMAVDTRADARGNRKLKRHWARVGLRRLEDARTPAEALFSFNVFAVDEPTYGRIRQLQLDYYDRVRALVDEAPGTDRVVLMNLQLIPLERAPRNVESD
jgi:transcriptional regulator with XRE-family HTH domain